jgi:1-acyl-sn-glycerol-3-phosphate acyltransferase
MRFKIVGGKIDEDATLILINHQSLLDIVIYEGLHPKDLAWVAKKEIADIPWFGRILDSSDMIIINRSDRRGLIKLLKDVKDRLDDNRPIAMFPEGTRGRGNKILKFKEGAKIIAEKYNLKVQPIVLCNTRNIVDSQNHLANGGLVTINYLPSFYPKDRGDDWFKILHEDMSKVYSDDLAEYFSNK